MRPNHQRASQQGIAGRLGREKPSLQPQADNRRESGQSDQMLPLQSTNANSVNSNELIFRAREIYEKYRPNAGRGTSLPSQDAGWGHPGPIHPHHREPRQQAGGPDYGLPSISGGFRSDQQLGFNYPRFEPKELITAETVPSITNFLYEKPTKNTEKFHDFLYLMIATFSSQIRVNQRLGLQNIYQYQRSVKKYTDFSAKVIGVMRKNIKLGFQSLKALKEPLSGGKKVNRTKEVEKKMTKIESLRESNFQMEESTVEKGLKFLEERSNQRKKLEQRMKTNQYGSIQPQPRTQKPPASFQFNAQIQKKPLTGRQNPFQPQSTPAKTQVIQKGPSNPNSNKKSESQYEDIYLRLERQSKNQGARYRVASWLAIELAQDPLFVKDKAEIFDRNETSERKYYLNPNTFKESQPDTHEGFMPILSNLGSEDLEIYEPEYEQEMHKKFGQKTTTDVNLLQDTLPVFDPNPIRPQKTLTGQLRSPESPKNKNWYQQREFDNLPSFNEKNRIMLNSAKKREEEERERRKSDLMGYKSGENSFKISDEGEEFHEEQQQGSNRKLHKLDQYYTDNNVLSQKKAANRASIEFTKQKRPLSRPKSMTCSIGKTELTQQSRKREESQMQKPAPKPQNLNTISQKPRITINYQSPRKQILMQPSFQYYGNPHPQPPMAIHQQPFHGQIQHNWQEGVVNKPTRAVSSEARFFGSFGPPQPQPQLFHSQQLVQPNYYPNSPRYMGNLGQRPLNLIRPSPMIQSCYGLPTHRNTGQMRGPSISLYSPQPEPSYPQPHPQPYSQPLQQQAQFQKKKGIELNSSPRAQLQHYGSDRQLQGGQSRPKAQLPSGMHSARKLKVVSADYY